MRHEACLWVILGPNINDQSLPSPLTQSPRQYYRLTTSILGLPRHGTHAPLTAALKFVHILSQNLWFLMTFTGLPLYIIPGSTNSYHTPRTLFSVPASFSYSSDFNFLWKISDVHKSRENCVTNLHLPMTSLNNNQHMTNFFSILFPLWFPSPTWPLTLVLQVWPGQLSTSSSLPFLMTQTNSPYHLWWPYSCFIMWIQSAHQNLCSRVFAPRWGNSCLFPKTLIRFSPFLQAIIIFLDLDSLIFIHLPSQLCND